MTAVTNRICPVCKLPYLAHVNSCGLTAATEPWQGPRSNTFRHGLSGLRVAYPVMSWPYKSDAWEHLHRQQIPGCPLVQLVAPETAMPNAFFKEIWTHGWQRDHVHGVEWAWVYVGART